MTVAEFYATINRIRANREMLSNAFFTKSQLEAFLGNNCNKVVYEDDLVVLAMDEPDLIRLYFYSDGVSPLRRLPKITSRFYKPVVLDVVGKGSAPEELATLLGDIGFQHYSTFIRMATKQITPLPYDREVQVVKAKLDDADLIARLLSEEFDPLFAHLPNENDIAFAIKKGEITAIYENALLTGFAYFEVISSRVKCLRYLLVRNEFRGRGYSSVLLMKELNAAEKSEIYYLWVGTYNKTIRLYSRIGFIEDGLRDYIMVYKK